MRILITGAFGYVGYSLVHSLLHEATSHELVLYDNVQSKNLNFFHTQKFKNAERIRQIFFNDILDNKALQHALEGVDVVVHLAAKVSTPFSDVHAHSFDQINNWGTAALVDAIEKCQSVKRIVYLSSVSVYGNTHGHTVTENDEPDPHSFYGISKLRAEKHIQRLKPDIERIIIRSGNVYGYNPCFRIDAVINRFAFDAHFKKKIHIRGPGDQKRAFIAVHNLAASVAEIISSDSLFPEIINLVDMNASVKEIANEVFKIWEGIEYVHSVNHMKMRSIAAVSTYEEFNKENVSGLQHCFQEFKERFSL